MKRPGECGGWKAGRFVMSAVGRRKPTCRARGINRMTEMIPMSALVLLLTSLSPLVISHIHPHARSGSGKKVEAAEADHLKEELELESFNFTSVENMTHEERDFHYFRLHDFDKNDLLDGLEVLKAMSHSHAKIMTEEADIDSSFDEMVGMIDKVAVNIYSGIVNNKMFL